MKTLIASAVLALLILGCANFSTQVFRTEQTVANVSYGTYVGYTQALYTGVLKITPAQSNEVKQARLKLGASLSTLDAWRASYETNSAMRPQVQAALDSALANSSNVVYLINLFRHQ